MNYIIESFGIYLVNFCKLLYIDFSPLATQRKSWMLSAVSGSLKLHAIYVMVRGLFSWSMGRIVTMDSIRPWEQRSSVVLIYKNPAL